MAPRMTSSKRFAVRTALVTSTTLATIMGAQALVSIDGISTPPPVESASQPAAAAPNIVILRRAGDQPVTSSTSSQIAPPRTVLVAPPPVVQRFIPRTEASR